MFTVRQPSLGFALIRLPDGAPLAYGQSRSSLEGLRVFLCGCGTECAVYNRRGSGAFLRNGEDFETFRERRNAYEREYYHRRKKAA